MPALKYYSIIVGGGSGLRMQTEIPKQFIHINGMPVLMHTIDAFRSSSFHPEIIVVLNQSQHEYWNELCKSHGFLTPHRVVAGGEQRFHSVKNGLKRVEDRAVVAIHDAVRPCVSKRLIDLAYQEASVKGNAVAAVKSRDSVRQVSAGVSVSVNRENIFLVQTPQVFTSEILLKAYEQEFQEDFTDDASVVERSGEKIHLIQGEAMNIKITYPEDLLIACELLKNV